MYRYYYDIFFFQIFSLVIWAQNAYGQNVCFPRKTEKKILKTSLPAMVLLTYTKPNRCILFLNFHFSYLDSKCLYRNVG